MLIFIGCNILKLLLIYLSRNKDNTPFCEIETILQQYLGKIQFRLLIDTMHSGSLLILYILALT